MHLKKKKKKKEYLFWEFFLKVLCFLRIKILMYNADPDILCVGFLPKHRLVWVVDDEWRLHSLERI